MFLEPGRVEVGIDEAGMGPIFGRVYAAAVIWPHDVEHPLLIDSKKLKKAEQHRAMSDFIKTHALDYAIVYRDAERIDEINIYRAVIECMHEAITNLKKVAWDWILVDGNRFIDYHSPETGRIYRKEDGVTTIIKGDAKFVPIACASILAKNARDRWVEEVVGAHPEWEQRYNLLSNKGYPSPAHQSAVWKYGITTMHRKSYRPCSTWLTKHQQQKENDEKKEDDEERLEIETPPGSPPNYIITKKREPVRLNASQPKKKTLYDYFTSL